MKYSIQRPPLAESFYVPPKEKLLSVKEGDLVKVIFEVDGETPERMWVIVKDCSSDNSMRWTGVVDNDPYGEKTAKILPAGTEVQFHPYDVINIDTQEEKKPSLFSKIKSIFKYIL